MKFIDLKIFNAFGLLFLILLTGCNKDDDEPTAEELQTSKLRGTWIVGTEGSVVRNGVSLDEWSGFTLSIEKGSYSASTVNQTVWAPSGTWKFYEDDLTRIERNDGVILDIHLSETILIVSFTIQESNSGGRLSSVDGEYTFTLIKQ